MSKLKPKEALKTAHALSNRQADYILKAMHNDYYGSSKFMSETEAQKPEDWLRAMCNKNEVEKVLSVWTLFIEKGKSGFWHDVFAEADGINRSLNSTRHNYDYENEYDGPSLPSGWWVDAQGYVRNQFGRR